MTKMKFRQLIDMAIGSPDLGHVDFQALHFLLTTFAERLEIVEDQIDYDAACKEKGLGREWGPKNLSDYYTTSPGMQSTPSPTLDKKSRTKTPRLTAGSEKSTKSITEKFHQSEETTSQNLKLLFEEESQTSFTIRAFAGEDEAAEAEGEAPAPAPAEEPAPPPPAPAPAPTEPEPPSPPPEEPGDDDVGGLPDVEPLDAAMSGRPYEPKSSEEQFTGENMKLGICMMKDQLELAMEQLTLLSEFLLEEKRDPKKRSILNRYLRRLRNIMRQNIYFESCFQRDASISWHDSEYCEEEGWEEDYVYEEKPMEKPAPPPKEPAPLPEICKDDLGLEPCLIYSPDQLLDMFLEMRSEFCQLLNKVNTIAATILEQDYHGLMAMTGKLQKEQELQSRQLKALQHTIGSFELKLVSLLKNVDQLAEDVEMLKELKADRREVLCWLTMKVNYDDLDKKLDKTQLIEFQDQVAQQFCVYREIINTNERNVMSIIDNLRETLGVNYLEKLLYALRDKFQKDIDMLNAKLDHYIALTDDECAAAAARVKVLKDLKCISCDTPCVMHKIERGKVGKMGSAHEGAMMGPLVTYELSRLRKSGIMGFHRKEDGPKTAKDFLQEDIVNIAKCKERHAGGPHTVTSRKDYADKVMQKAKKKGSCLDDDEHFLKPK